MKLDFKARENNITADRRIDFYGFLITLVGNRENLQEACNKVSITLTEQAKEVLWSRHSLKRTAQLYAEVALNLRKGKPLSKALQGRIPDSEVLMLMTGERGDLIQGLKAAQLEAKAVSQMASVFKKSLTYPIILAFVVVGALVYVGNNLLPTIEMVVPVRDWSEGQRQFYWVTQNVALWLPVVLGSLVSLGLLIKLVNTRVIGAPRESFQWLPPFNVIRKMTSANYLTTLSSLITAGETLMSSLAMIQKSSSSNYLDYYVGTAIDRLRGGAGSLGPGNVIGDKLFTPWVMVKLKLYGEGNITTFTERMLEIAEDARTEALQSVSGLAALINVVMLVLVGVVIGMSVITMYSILGTLQAGPSSF